MDEQKLKSVPLFASLGRDELRRVAQVTDEIDVPEGKVLLEQGQLAYEFMVIQDGRADVMRDGEHIADLGPGDFLGEIAALEGGTRTATVVATSPMSLFVTTAREFRRLASDVPQIGRGVEEVCRQRHPLAQPA